MKSDARGAVAGYAEAYERNGYFTVPGVFSRGEVEALREETLRVFRGERDSVRA